MPDMSGEPQTPASLIKDLLGSYLSPLPVGFTGIFVVVGLVVAGLIYGLGDHEKFDTKIGKENGFLFLAAIVFGRMVISLNFYPMEHKAKIMKSSSKNLRTNMAIYKQLNKDGGAGLTVHSLCVRARARACACVRPCVRACVRA